MSSDPKWSPAQKHALRHALNPETQHCPEPHQLHAHVDDHGSFEIETHLTVCAACRTEAGLYREFLAAEASPEEQAALDHIIASRKPFAASSAPQPQPGLRNTLSGPLKSLGWMHWAGASAALLLAIALGVEWNRGIQPPPEGAAGVYRSAAKLTIEPSGDLEAPPTVFRWDAAQNAVSHTVRLVEVDGNVLWSGTVGNREVRTSDQWKRWMKPGKTLHLEVSALDAQGRVVASGSTAFRVRVKGSPE
ncbi:MAG: hypothetical protein JNL98_16345 [Bryobacterales bacterium]|nr:hypothetical protein [Bryobacterales bacterium]